MERKLTTILAADVVGYSALMERDEAGTHERLKAGRKELFEPEIARHHGHVFKLMGDGMLAEFGSVVDAVECAVSLQRGLAERNAEVPDDQRIQVRIGINLGEVIVEGDDRYGEGVNIAARLEQLADPGGICVSAKVAKEVEKKLAFGFEPMGAQQVKNIAEPIEAFRVKLDGTSKSRPVHLRKRGVWRHSWAAAAAVLTLAVAGLVYAYLQSGGREGPPLPDKPSIAVLPFDNLSDDLRQTYFADGMAEDLITDLSKLSGIFVVARNSSWTYKGKSVKVQQVGEELGVRYVLEGSVRRDGERVRINVQLIDAQGGQHLWAERYDGSTKDVFALQDRVIGQIVAALAVNLTGDEKAKVAQIETRNPLAYDTFLEGWEHFQRDTEADTNKAIELFERVITQDPNFARAQAALVAASLRILKSSWEAASGGGFTRAYNRINSILASPVAQADPLTHAVSAELMSLMGHYEEAFVAISRALALNPNDPNAYVSRARVLNAIGRAPEAEEAVRKAMRLDPHFPLDYRRVLAMSLFHQERYREAADTLQTLLDQNSENADDYTTMVASLGHLGETNGVAAAIQKFNNIAVGAGYSPMTVQEQGNMFWYGDIFDYHRPYLDRLAEGLSMAGVMEGQVNPGFLQYSKLMHRSMGEYSVDGATKIDVVTAKSLRDRGVVFVDVRAPKDFARGHVPGAKNIDVKIDMTKQSVLKVASLNDEIVFSCHGRYCMDSACATSKAVVWGFTRVYYFAGGFPAWKDAGYPIEISAVP